jgi:hypothetical protein
MPDTSGLAGKTVKGLRELTAEEMDREAWDGDNLRPNATAIEFTDGSIIYASQDDEGNGPGALFGALADGTPVAYITTYQKGDEK